MNKSTIKICSWGISLFHWGLELFAGCSLLLSTLIMLLLVVIPLDGIPFKEIIEAKPYLLNFFTLLMIAGIALGTLVPKESDCRKWIYAILLLYFLASGFRLMGLLLNFPTLFTESYISVVIIGILYVKFLANVCGWQHRLIDSTQSNNLQIPENNWQSLEKRCNRLWIYSILTIVFGVLLPFVSVVGLSFLISIGLPISFLGLIPVLCPVLAILFLILLLVRFSRTVYLINFEFKKVLGKIKEDDEVPPSVNTSKTTGYLWSLLALLVFSGNIYFEYYLNPEYQLRMLRNEMASLDGGDIYDIKLTGISDETVDFSTFKGKVIVLNFWATWCSPCVHEIPDLNRIHQEMKDDVVVVGISREPVSTIKEFTQNHKMDYKVCSGSISSAPFVMVLKIPTTFIIDQNGKIIDKIEGRRNFEAFKKSILKAKSEKADRQ